MRRAIWLSLICIGFMTASKHGSAAQQQPLTEEEAFQLGWQVGMLDATDRANLKQLSVVGFGKDTGPHNLQQREESVRYNTAVS